MYKPILLLDFDGVIHSYDSGWKGARIILDMPVTGALGFIVKALEHFDVMIYSSRSNQFGGIRAMKKWLYDRYLEIGGVKRTGWPSPFNQFTVNTEIPEEPKWWRSAILTNTSMEPWEWEVHYGVKRLLKRLSFPKKKPPAFMTIDDRGFQFQGVWPRCEDLLKFKPWNKKDRS